MHKTNLAKENLKHIIKKLSSPISPISPEIKEKIHSDSQIKAVIFDVYGTLFVSGSGDIGAAKKMSNEDALLEALNNSRIIDTKKMPKREKKQLATALLDNFYREIEKTHTIKKQEGIDFPEVDIIEIWRNTIENTTVALSKNIKNISREKLMQLSVEYEFRTNRIWPMPGALTTLKKLNQRDILLGIISNAQFFTPLMIETLLGESLNKLGFKEDLILWSYIEGRAKPSVFLFEKERDRLQKKYKILPSETLYIGNDMLNDILPAVKTGFKTCLFAGDSRSLRMRKDNPKCKKIEPDYIVTGLGNLLKIV